jgi:hypothetical protein
MDLTEGSETSAKHNLTPGKYPKEHIQDSEHGENLKSRKDHKHISYHVPTATCFGSKQSAPDKKSVLCSVLLYFNRCILLYFLQIRN